MRKGTIMERRPESQVEIYSWLYGYLCKLRVGEDYVISTAPYRSAWQKVLQAHNTKYPYALFTASNVAKSPRP